MEGTKIRIAVSGAGGGVGQSIIKSLTDTDYEVVALDGEVLGTGLYAAEKSYLIPYANHPEYLNRVLAICKQEGCRLLFPGLDAELPVLSKATDRFKAIGTEVIVSQPSVVSIGDDKLLTYTELTKLGVRVPETVDMSVHASSKLPLSLPFILKKRIGGARSKDVYLIKTADEYTDFLAVRNDTDTYIAQAYIEGEEYTCGSVNLDGECKGIIVMRRVLRDGDTYKCFSVRDEQVEAVVHKIMSGLKPFGACNVQLRLQDGVPYVFEINARCSGTTAARTLCGFNEPKMIADYLCFSRQPTYKIEEQTILRYWQELVVANNSVRQLEQTGFLDKPGGKL